MKKLIVYYSKTGNTEFIAKELANEIDAELLQLERKNPINSRGFGLYFKGGFQSFTKRKPKIKSFKQNIQEYDLIFIGTPIWAGKFNPVLRTLFSEVKLTNKKIALFCSCADNAKKALEELKKVLQENEILGTTEFIEPLKNQPEESSRRAREWANKIVAKS
ncbi:MAG: flavodoxin [Candidatus Heimdallarchaeota archaeon]|nr:flavodoxin [Candidatus Heimdallarchaeota archaeon]